MSFNPFAVGIGIDEDTAAMISPENVVHVVGSGTVTVVDVGAAHMSIADAALGDPPHNGR